jgi:hypothetical protein
VILLLRACAGFVPLMVSCDITTLEAVKEQVFVFGNAWLAGLFPRAFHLV